MLVLSIKYRVKLLNLDLVVQRLVLWARNQEFGGLNLWQREYFVKAVVKTQK